MNYWPARTAMDWWSLYDRAEVEDDFARIAASGFDSVRIFLTWEAFQPGPRSVDPKMVERLVEVADVANNSELELIPTLFTGHMSGVNWIPGWALGGSAGDARFRVVSGGRTSRDGLRNWYADEAVIDAQCLLAAEVAVALRGHDAIWALDLGNENSNCVIPPDRQSARAWLARVAATIRGVDDCSLITVGLHMEDLEEDRQLGPSEAGESGDFLSMHGYPIYASWAEGATDSHLLPFLARVTRWLGGRKDVLFSEFGLPTHRPAAGFPGASRDPHLVDEDAAAAYTASALEELRSAGCLGAMLWCYSDYDTARWSIPPLDLARHERSFGLWRADGSPKPAVAAVAAFAGVARCAAAASDAWIDIEPETFLLDPGAHLRRLYRRYRNLDV